MSLFARHHQGGDGREKAMLDMRSCRPSVAKLPPEDWKRKSKEGKGAEGRRWKDRSTISERRKWFTDVINNKYERFAGRGQQVAQVISGAADSIFYDIFREKRIRRRIKRRNFGKTPSADQVHEDLQAAADWTWNTSRTD